MPRKLLASYSELLSKEKIEFKKAIQREYAKAKREGSALANIDVETLSIVAKGNEILPPATPEAAPVKPEPAVEPAIADASPQTPSSSQEVQANQDVQTASSPAETASTTALTAIPTPSPVQPSPNDLPVASNTGPNVPSVVEVENNSESVANASVQQAGDPAAVLTTGPAVIPVPQPAQRETAAAAEPAKKTPWWQRKKPEPQS